MTLVVHQHLFRRLTSLNHKPLKVVSGWKGKICNHAAEYHSPGEGGVT